MAIDRTVIHLVYKDKNYYFGSIKAIFDYFSSDDLGVHYNTLRNYGLSSDKPYKNSRCVIFKGILRTKQLK